MALERRSKSQHKFVRRKSQVKSYDRKLDDTSRPQWLSGGKEEKHVFHYVQLAKRSCGGGVCLEDRSLGKKRHTLESLGKGAHIRTWIETVSLPAFTAVQRRWFALHTSASANSCVFIKFINKNSFLMLVSVFYSGWELGIFPHILRLCIILFLSTICSTSIQKERYNCPSLPTVSALVD